MVEINGWLLLAQTLTFLIGVFILWKIAWGPLTKLMNEREENIRKTITEANDLRAKTENLKTEYETKISQIQQTKQEMLTAVQNESTKIKDDILRSAQSEAKQLIDKTKKQLDQERENLLVQLRNDVTKLSVIIAEKLLK